MNGQLAQILRYLDRDGVSEVVLSVGHPVSMRTANGMTNVTARAISSDQLQAIIRDTDIARLVASKVEDEEIELQTGTRSVVARVTRHDDGVTVTLTHAVTLPPPVEMPVELPVEFDIDLAVEPPEEPVAYDIDLGTEPPVRLSVEPPRTAPAASGAPLLRKPPPLAPGIDLHLSFDDLPDFGEAPPAPPRAPALAPQPAPPPKPIAGDRNQRPMAAVFQRVDLRDARSPTPSVVRTEPVDDSSAWADIDLAPPSRRR